MAVFPHGLEYCFEIAFADLGAPGGEQAAHDQQCVDGKMRIEAEVAKAVLVDETLCFEPFVFQFAFHVAEGSHRGLVPRQLEQSAQQAGNEIHLRVAARRDVG